MSGRTQRALRGPAWAGLVLCWPGLRRMTAAVGGTVVAPEQPYGTAHEPRPRVVAADMPRRMTVGAGPETGDDHSGPACSLGARKLECR